MHEIGEWTPDTEVIHCKKCGNSYNKVNGYWDCLSQNENDNHPQDQMSSFAYEDDTDQKIMDLRRIINYLAAKSGIAHFDKFLDIGCGFGNMVIAASEYSNYCFGVNTDSSELKKAAQRLKSRNITNVYLFRATAQNLPFVPNQMDAITCIQVLEHVRNSKEAIVEFFSSLKNTGIGYMSCPNRYSIKPEPHTHLWGIGYFPRSIAYYYAKTMKRIEEFNSVHLLSYTSISKMLNEIPEMSYSFIRSGFHQSFLGKLAKYFWNVPILNKLARHFLGDIEIIITHKQTF